MKKERRGERWKEGGKKGGKKERKRDFAGGPVVKTVLPMQGTWV